MSGRRTSPDFGNELMISAATFTRKLTPLTFPEV
jgi:hypothetical protein